MKAYFFPQLEVIEIKATYFINTIGKTVKSTVSSADEDDKVGFSICGLVRVRTAVLSLWYKICQHL